MLSFLLAASMGGYPACQTVTGYAGGYGTQYVATPYVAQSYATSYATPTYYNKVVTAFVPIAQVDAYRTEIVGDQARAAQYAASRLQADTNLVNAITGLAANLDKFRAQVDAATKVQDQAFQAKQYQPPPVAQYPVQPSPQVQYPAPPSKSAPADYGQVPEPPRASLQVPDKGFPTLSPANVPPPPTSLNPYGPDGSVRPGFKSDVSPPPSPDVPQGDPGTFPTGPVQPQGFQAQPSGPLSPAIQAATATLYRRCGSCHSGGSPSGGLTIFATKDQLARTDPEFVRLLDRVAFTGYVAKRDPSTGVLEKLKMPPSGRGFSAEEYASIRGMLAEVEDTALASNAGPR